MAHFPHQLCIGQGGQVWELQQCNGGIIPSIRGLATKDCTFVYPILSGRYLIMPPIPFLLIAFNSPPPPALLLPPTLSLLSELAGSCIVLFHRNFPPKTICKEKLVFREKKASERKIYSPGISIVSTVLEWRVILQRKEGREDQKVRWKLRKWNRNTREAFLDELNWPRFVLCPSPTEIIEIISRTICRLSQKYSII